MQFFILLASDGNHSIAVLFICTLLSNAGQYFQDFRLNGKWLQNLWRLIYDEIGKASKTIQWSGF